MHSGDAAAHQSAVRIIMPIILIAYCPNGANAPQYRECPSAISYGTVAIKITKP